MIAIGAQMMARVVLFNVVFMPIEIFGGAMRGTGHSVAPMLVMCICICLYRVIWVMTVVAKYHYIELLAVCYPISWALAGVVLFILYLRGNWLKSTTNG